MGFWYACASHKPYTDSTIYIPYASFNNGGVVGRYKQCRGFTFGRYHEVRNDPERSGIQVLGSHCYDWSLFTVAPRDWYVVLGGWEYGQVVVDVLHVQFYHGTRAQTTCKNVNNIMFCTHAQRRLHRISRRVGGTLINNIIFSTTACGVPRLRVAYDLPNMIF